MPRQRCSTIDDSDVSSADEDGSDAFDIDEDKSGSDTDATSIEDPDPDDADVDDEADVEDQIVFLGGNVHLPEYYRQAVGEFNESVFDCEDYSPRTTTLLDMVEEQWCQYVYLPHVSFLLVLTTSSLGSAAVSYYRILNNATKFSSHVNYIPSSTGSLTRRLGKMARRSGGSRKRVL